MQIITKNSQTLPFQGCVLSIGNFDGVHLGHQAMLLQLQQLARKKKVASVVMTFDPPPVALIAPQYLPPRLSTIKRKAELIEKLGIDCLYVFPTTSSFLSLSAEQFFQKIVVQQFQASGIVEGENFYFGKQRQGDINLLKQLATQNEISLQIIKAVNVKNEMISSTRIRKLISAGKISEAVDCLGHPYQLTGTVVAGEQRGRQLGFPTANLAHLETLIPSDGVYAGRCLYGGQQYSAAINVGGNPTFTTEERKIEVHIIGLDADLYGQNLSVDFIARCRDVMPFDNKQQLQQQLKKDVQQVIQITQPK